MKLSTTEKIMKVWGWISLVILILGIPTQFVNKYLLKMEFETSVMVMFIVSSVIEMLLSIAFIRCKKDSFLVVAMGGQVLYRLIVIIMNLSTVSIPSFINLAVYILFLLFVAGNCVPKLSEYKQKINKFWFVPSVAMLTISIIGFISNLFEKLPGLMDTINVQGAESEAVIQTFSLGLGVSSSVLGILPYLLLSYWIYKSYKIEN